MLHNTGPYGPNDAPINMGTPVNMTQMTPSMNIAHNMNNLGKIAPQAPQPTSSHYNLPSYPTYGHPSLGMSPHVSSFQNYHPVGFQHNYMVQTPPSIHDTSWQNGMLPMNLNAHAQSSNHMLGYPSPYDKRTPINPDYKEEGFSRKNMPINIPQVPMKAFQKLDTDSNYGLYNVNQDKFNYLNHNLDLSTRASERPIMDNTRRKSLENTVRLIENILISTTKNKEMQRNQEAMNEKIAEAMERTPEDIPKITEASKPQEETQKLTIQKTVEAKLPAEEETVKESKDIEIEKETSVHEGELSELSSEEEEEETEKNDETKSSSESEDEKQSEDQCETEIGEITNNVIVKLECESEPDANIVVKVEQLCWTDTEYLAPFERDVHGVPREDVTNDIIDNENSVNEATAVIKSGLNPKAHYECPQCNLYFSHPKRFLIHTKWHSFGLTNEKRQELAREREIWRNQRKEARVVDRMNSKEVTDEVTGKKVYPCKDCDKAFFSKGSLKNHRQRHHPTRIRECKICRKSLLGWMALRAHLATHNNESGYQCVDCPKKFKYAHSLAKHRDTHLEKTVSCEQCPKMFGTAAQLKMHMKVHERAQRGTTYHCSYCAKGFYEAYNLAVHERTHRNERPFVCEICHTSFGTNSSLKRHMKVSHNAAKPYECSTCHRSFITESIRDRHELRAHGDPDDFKFTCDQCECRYLKLKDLQKHVYKAHPKGKRKKKDKSDSE